MPTYKNNTNETISVNVFGGTVYVNPGQTYITEYIINGSALTLLSATPYYNPVVNWHRVVSTGPGDDKTVNLDINKTKTARILKINTTGNIDVYLRSTNNYPPILLDWNVMDPIADISIDGKCDCMILQFSASGNCYIVELKDVME
jgi:hypothetical protein